MVLVIGRDYDRHNNLKRRRGAAGFSQDSYILVTLPRPHRSNSELIGVLLDVTEKRRSHLRLIDKKIAQEHMEAIAIMEFAKFMSSGLGRGLRIVAGLALIAIGLFLMDGIWGIVVAVVGAVPFFAGLFDVCVIGALFLGTPFKGDEVRAGLPE